MIRRSQFLATSVASVGVVVGPLRVRADDLAPVRLGVLKIGSDAPFFLAEKLGYFAAEGIKVNYTQFQSSEQMMPLLAQGQLDVGGGAPGASLYNAVIHGSDIRAVADATSDPPGYGFAKLLVRTDLVKSGRYKSIKDLKGMHVAGAARASSSAPQWAHLLAKAGLKIDDVKREALPYPQHVVAFQNGAIDAALTSEPFATRTVEVGAAVQMGSNDEFYPNQQASVILYGGPFATNNHDSGMRFLRAFVRGVRYYTDNLKNGHIDGPAADDIIKLMATETGAPESVFRSVTPNAMNPNAHVNLASMRDDLAFYKEQGFIEGSITADQVVDDSFATQVIRQLGTYKRRK
jgi:NitT/TauT family transport system substrate-binding protein